MNPDLLKSWLRKQKASAFAQHLLLGLLGLLAGLLVLFLTFWFTYAVIWFGWLGVSAVSDLIFSRKLSLSHALRLAASGIFLLLLFLQHFRTSRWHWGDYPNRDYNEDVALVAHVSPLGALGALLVYPGASANMIADILLSGPRLVTGSCQLAAQGFRWRRLDENACAELLACLCSRPGAVPYEELQAAGRAACAAQLRGVAGVQFLQKGVVLSGDLRHELSNLK